MNRPEGGEPRVNSPLRQTAREWVVRRDWGLTPSEEKEFDDWLKSDPRHAEAFAHSSTMWTTIDDRRQAVLVPLYKRALFRKFAAAAALAACVALASVGWWRLGIQGRETATIGAEEARVTRLSDGTLVFLKAGSEVTEGFTPAERRVLLLRGEAHFDVFKNPDRPFVVRAGAVEVRAVGTAFNVQMQKSAVEVRVTEGRVRVAADPAHAAVSPVDAPIVEAGQRAVVQNTGSNAPGPIVISQMDESEVERTLAWQEPLLRLRGLTLAQLATQFATLSGKRLLLADPELGKIEIGGTLRADNLEGLVWLLESNHGLKAELTAEGDLVISKGAGPSR